MEHKSLAPAALQNLRKIFQKSVEAVCPVNLLSAANNYNLRPQYTGEGDERRLTIQIQGKTLDITHKRCHVVGFGKAVLGMAVQLERALQQQLVGGVLSIPTGTLRQFAGVAEMQLGADTRLQVVEGAANNQPDATALQAAQSILKLAASLSADDVLFVLISGGGSALLPLPRAPLTLAEKMQLVRQLANRGAAIDELNLVRIALSDVKGGRLAAAARHAAAVISFVISDVVGDPVDLIASGPTCAALTQRRTTAEEVLRKHEMWTTLPAHIRDLIATPAAHADTQPGRNNSIYVVGDNRVATACAVQEALQCGYNPFIASTTLQGELTQLVGMYRDFLQSICCFRRREFSEEQLRLRFPFDSRIFQHFLKTLLMCEKTGKPLLLILAGEPTVKVTGSGLGGRNQELALRMSLEFYENADFKNISFLSAGTDGIDGPTPAAGALGSSLVIEEYLKSAEDNGLDTIKELLKNSDSYNFYKQLNAGQFHVMTGHTGTNVMDLQLVLVA